MATSINWPPSLPVQPVTAGYGETSGVNVLRTPMDAGPPKMRRISRRADVLTLGFRLTTAQVATLETFVKTTTAGVARFNFTHPRKLTSVEVRIVPTSEGEYYKTSYIGPGLWMVSLQMEVLPT